MSRSFATTRTVRAVLRHYVTLLAAVVFVFAHAYGTAQNLKFVPVIYNYPLNNANDPAVLETPNNIAVDVHGSLYIADTGLSKVWKVDPYQTVTVFAGTGSSTLAGDGGLAVNANLNHPTAVAVDTFGNVFIADTNNFAIRRVDALTGVITTVAGGNGYGYSGDNGPATSAQLQNPTGIAVDGAHNIYIADATSKVVRKVSSTGTITTFAGGGSPASGNGDGGLAIVAKLTAPRGLALDATGNLYIADAGASVVRKVDTTNTISTFAGSTVGNSGVITPGPATSAKLSYPSAVAVDNSTGNVYITDATTGIVSVVDTTNTISLVAGRGLFGGLGDGEPAFIGQIPSPDGVAVDNFGNVFIDSNTAGKVYKIITHPERFPFTNVGQSTVQQRLIVQNTGSSSITISGVSFSGDYHLATTIINPNSSPCTTSFDSTLAAGGGIGSYCTIDVIFTPTAAGIRSFNLTLTSNDTPSTTTIALTSTGMNPTMAVSGGTVFNVAGKVPPDLAHRSDNVIATTTGLSEVTGIAFDSASNIYLAEASFCDVRKVDAQTGLITTVAGSLQGLCGGPGGGGSATPDGIQATASILDSADGLAIGPDNTIYISDGTNNSIWAVNPSGIIRHIAGMAQQANFPCNVQGDGGQATATHLCGVFGMAVDTNGNLIFAEQLVNAIRKITPGGVISTIGGTFGAANGHSGDNGPASSATIDNPWGLVLDSHNNIYFVERDAHDVRRIDATTNVITTVAGTPTVSGYTGDGGLATKARLQVPEGLGIDAAGNLYIADSGNQAIRKVDAATGIITTIAGNIIMGDLANPNSNIPATSTGVNFPASVAVDAAGYVLFSDDSILVREISPNGLLDFGNQLVSTTSGFQTLSISNIGNMPMHFDATTPYAVAGDFSFVSGGTCNFTQPLAVGASCTIHLQFTPTATFERYGTLTFNDDGTASPQVTQLRGNGLQPATQQAVLAPAPLNFPDTTVNTTSATQIMTLSNPGTATLNIASISLVGANPSNFAIVSTATCGSAVPAGSSCSIVLSFTPSSVAPFSATVMVTDDAPNSPQSATITGNGIVAAAPQAVLTPAGGLTFTSTVGTTSASQTFTLTNPGNATLNITGVSVGGATPAAFTATSTGVTACGSTLAAGAQCTISVTFTPTSTTPVTANVSVADNAANSPQLGPLSGTGTPVPITPDFTIAATPPSANIVNGASAQYTINLASLSVANPFASAVSLTATGLPAGATATFVPPTGTPGTTGASSTMTVQTLKATAALDEKGPFGRGPTIGIVSFAFLFFTVTGLRKHRRIPRLLVIVFALILGGIGAAGITGCGGGYALPSGTVAPRTYTITVTGTSGSVQHSTTVTLTVN